MCKEIEVEKIQTTGKKEINGNAKRNRQNRFKKDTKTYKQTNKPNKQREKNYLNKILGKLI